MSTMNKEQKQLHRELVKLTGATKKYKPFEWGKSIYPYFLQNELTLRGQSIANIEVWKDQSWYLSCDMHIIAGNTDLTNEEITQVYNIINNRKQ